MDAFKIKRGLGRGLSSLIGDSKIETNINKLSISDLVRNKNQPRKLFDKDSLEGLTNSIKERGIIQEKILSTFSSNNSSILEKIYKEIEEMIFNELPPLDQL